MTDLDWVAPDACTLPTVDQPLRVAEFDALFAQSLRRAELVDPAQAFFEFVGDDPAGLATRVRDLADRETSCCSFFAFDVRVADASTVVLDVRVPSTRADVLAALVRRAESMAERRG
jgi:hypothetical protein